ncbi:MAG TPA: thioredoxin family protein [Chloroflexia bacterium]|nr:thioredoxin family protein [Chloroflexia bacterium]
MNTLATITPERFAEGLTLQEFRNGMRKNREIYEENYKNFKLKPEDLAFLQGYGRNLKLVVLAEDWCGDVLRYMPILQHMCEAARTWEVRVFYRDENTDLADMWLKDGKFRAIPVIAFHDEQLREIACYVEKPAIVYAEDERGKSTFADRHADLPDAALPTSQMSEATFELYSDFIRQFRLQNRTLWQQWFVDEVREKLQRASFAVPGTAHMLQQPDAQA